MNRFSRTASNWQEARPLLLNGLFVEKFWPNDWEKANLDIYS